MVDVVVVPRRHGLSAHFPDRAAVHARSPGDGAQIGAVLQFMRTFKGSPNARMIQAFCRHPERAPIPVLDDIATINNSTSYNTASQQPTDCTTQQQNQWHPIAPTRIFVTAAHKSFGENYIGSIRQIWFWILPSRPKFRSLVPKRPTPKQRQILFSRRELVVLAVLAVAYGR
jgi:hypothetical protein